MRSSRPAPRSSASDCWSRSRSSWWRPLSLTLSPLRGERGSDCKGGEDAFRVRNPPEDPALGFDHSQPDFVKLREVRTAAVAGDDAAVAAIVRLAHGRMNTHLRRHAAHDQVLDAAIRENRLEIGREER